jgi:hypothetical protein
VKHSFGAKRGRKLESSFGRHHTPEDDGKKSHHKLQLPDRNTEKLDNDVQKIFKAKKFQIKDDACFVIVVISIFPETLGQETIVFAKDTKTL